MGTDQDYPTSGFAENNVTPDLDIFNQNAP
jgi:hypothetical protein